jgi:tRNA modification GTPase
MNRTLFLGDDLLRTIFALSSATGKAGVAVIRISGTEAGPVVKALTGSLPLPRLASLRTFRDPKTGEALDRGLLLWFPGPASFTGEDMAELHTHGSRAVLDAMFQALARFPELTLAEPGEFTKRAFENGKLDLTEAEGLADLINAETEAQRQQAFRQADGDLRLLYDEWRRQLIEALASLEAELDFSDEGDIPNTVAEAARASVALLRGKIRTHLADGRRGEILRDGLSVVIVGPPNGGKSSLMNKLVQRDVAIVSTEAGTTRDVIEIHLDLSGYPVILTDTAGIREAQGAIEEEGIRRTWKRAQEADLLLWLRDATDEDAPGAESISDVTNAPAIEVVNKIDLVSKSKLSASKAALHVSAVSGEGLDLLISRLTDEASKIGGDTSSTFITRARHRRELETCASALDHFLENDFSALELRAEDLRHAATALGRLTGRIDVEDVLDKIFSEFCVGK